MNRLLLALSVVVLRLHAVTMPPCVKATMTHCNGLFVSTNEASDGLSVYRPVVVGGGVTRPDASIRMVNGEWRCTDLHGSTDSSCKHALFTGCSTIKISADCEQLVSAAHQLVPRADARTCDWKEDHGPTTAALCGAACANDTSCVAFQYDSFRHAGHDEAFSGGCSVTQGKYLDALTGKVATATSGFLMQGFRLTPEMCPSHEQQWRVRRIQGGGTCRLHTGHCRPVGHIQFFNQQEAKCANSHEAIRSWKMEESPCVGGQRRLVTECCQDSRIGQCRVVHTQCAPTVNLTLEWLNQHNVFCGEKEVLKSFQMEHGNCDADKQRFRMECCSFAGVYYPFVGVGNPTKYVLYNGPFGRFQQGFTVGLSFEDAHKRCGPTCTGFCWNPKSGLPTEFYNTVPHLPEFVSRPDSGWKCLRKRHPARCLLSQSCLAGTMKKEWRPAAVAVMRPFRSLFALNGVVKTSKTVGSWAECEALCAKTGAIDCEAYVYRPTPKTCELKTKTDGSGLVSSSAITGFNTVCELKHGERLNMDAPLKPLFETKLGTDLCCQRCRRTQGCRVWTLHKDSSTCYGFSAFLTKTTQTGWVSGAISGAPCIPGIAGVRIIDQKVGSGTSRASRRKVTASTTVKNYGDVEQTFQLEFTFAQTASETSQYQIMWTKEDQETTVESTTTSSSSSLSNSLAASTTTEMASNWNIEATIGFSAAVVYGSVTGSYGQSASVGTSSESGSTSGTETGQSSSTEKGKVISASEGTVETKETTLESQRQWTSTYAVSVPAHRSQLVTAVADTTIVTLPWEVTVRIDYKCGKPSIDRVIKGTSVLSNYVDLQHNVALTYHPPQTLFLPESNKAGASCASNLICRSMGVTGYVWGLAPQWKPCHRLSCGGTLTSLGHFASDALCQEAAQKKGLNVVYSTGGYHCQGEKCEGDLTKVKATQWAGCTDLKLKAFFLQGNGDCCPQPQNLDNNGKAASYIPQSEAHIYFDHESNVQGKYLKYHQCCAQCGAHADCMGTENVNGDDLCCPTATGVYHPCCPFSYNENGELVVKGAHAHPKLVRVVVLGAMAATLAAVAVCVWQRRSRLVLKKGDYESIL